MTVQPSTQKSERALRSGLGELDVRQRMRPLCMVLAICATTSCSTVPRLESPVALSDAIFTLPSQALAGISTTGRQNYVEDKSGDYNESTRRLHLYGDDWKGRWGVHSMVYLRLFEDEQGRTVAASHSAGPIYAGRALSDNNTNVFRIERGRWVDVTKSVLPDATPRSWWFRFDDDRESIPCGPYLEYPHPNGRAHRQGDPPGDLFWRNGRFQFKPRANNRMQPTSDPPGAEAGR